MSSVGNKGVIIQDSLGGDAVTVTNSRLDVNAQITVASDDINIGNVVLQTDGGLDIHSSMAVTDTIPNLDQGTLLGTHALLSARSDASTTLGITCEDSTHNALHVSISDGAGIAHVDGNNALLVDVVAGGVLESTVDGIEGILSTIDTDTGSIAGVTNGIGNIPNVIGTSGIAGPSKCLSIAGTRSGGALRELLVDSDGHLQIDVLTTANTAGTTIASYPQFDVDTSPLQLSDGAAIDAEITTAKEIIIQCGFTNTGYIVVGDSSLVAAEGVDSMDGIRLEAGDTLTLAATTTENIWLRGSAVDQLVNVMIIS